MKIRRPWFLPGNLDTLEKLVRQLEVVEQMLATLSKWVGGTASDTSDTELRGLARTAYELDRQLNNEVRRSFSTPLRSDDLLALGEALGELAQTTYALVREADLSGTEPDASLRAIVDASAAAFRPLAAAVRQLPHERAATLADESLQLLNAAERSYRAAIADLEYETDLRRELRRRELYRRSESLVTAAHALARRVACTVL